MPNNIEAIPVDRALEHKLLQGLSGRLTATNFLDKRVTIMLVSKPKGLNKNSEKNNRKKPQ